MRLVPALALALVVSTACGSGAAVSTHHRQQHPSAISTRTTPAPAPRCTTSQLEVWLGVGAGGATAGSTYYPMELTNISRHACHLHGYPGVSAWNGHRDGSPAARQAGDEPTVMLAAGATAHTVLRLTDFGTFPHERCRPVTATMLKVYPPGEYTSTAIPFSFRACGRVGPAFLSIAPIEPGIGIPGYPGP